MLFFIVAMNAKSWPVLTGHESIIVGLLLKKDVLLFPYSHKKVKTCVRLIPNGF